MTPRPVFAPLLVAGAGLFALAFSGACADETLKLCGEIPAKGCPAGRGGSCEDPTCAGLYDCQDGRWIELTACASGGDGGGGGRGDAGPDGAACSSFSVNHQGEVSGCTPDLQSPDCPAEAAEACASVACLTGCLDFFLCTKDGWTAVAYCDEDGNIAPAP